MGTTYEETIEEEFDAADDGPVYLSLSLTIEDTFDAEDDTWPSQLIRVAHTFLEVVTPAPLRPVRVAHMFLEVVVSPTTYEETIEEEFDAEDASTGGFIFYESSEDEFDISPTLSWYRRIDFSCAESVSATESNEYICDYNALAAETLLLYEQLTWAWNKTIADAFNAADVSSVIWAIKAIADVLETHDIIVTGWTGQEPITEYLVSVDNPTIGELFDDTIADTFQAADTLNIVLMLILTEMIAISETIVSQGEFQHTIADTATARDLSKHCWEKTIADTFAANDTQVLRWLIMASIAESLGTEELIS